MREIVEVTQADRDAAADYGRAMASISPREADAIRRGEWDDLPRVQWVARYRATLIETQQAMVGELREGLDDLQQAEAEYRLMHDRHGDGSGAAGRAWDRMRRAGNKARDLLERTPL